MRTTKVRLTRAEFIQVFISVCEMAESIEANVVTYKHFKYVSPTSPANIVDSTVFTLDFVDSKFINVGFDQPDDFNVMIQKVTPSRHVVDTSGFLNRIFAFVKIFYPLFLKYLTKHQEQPSSKPILRN